MHNSNFELVSITGFTLVEVESRAVLKLRKKSNKHICDNIHMNLLGHT